MQYNQFEFMCVEKYRSQTEHAAEIQVRENSGSNLSRQDIINFYYIGYVIIAASFGLYMAHSTIC